MFPREKVLVTLFLGLSAAGCAAGPSTVDAPAAASAPHVASAPPAVASAPLPPAVDPQRDDAAIAQAGKDYVALLVKHSPETATTLGIHDRDTELDDRSPEATARMIAESEAMLAALEKRFASVSASPEARVDLEILRGSLSVTVRSWKELDPLARSPDLYASPQNALFLMMAREYAPAAERAKNVLARMDKLPEVIAHAKRNLKSPPKVWTQVGIEMAEGAAAFFDEQEKPLSRALPGEEKRVKATVAAAKKAYADYARFLTKEVLPRSSGSFAVGKPFFDFLLRDGAFLSEDSAAVLAIGKRVLAATSAQMTEVAKRIDPKAKGWQEVHARVKAHHPTAKELLPSYRREVARARAFLVQKDVVPFPPGDDCEVIETPPFLRSTVSAAYDQPPPLDAGTKGFFFVTPVDPKLPAKKQEAMLREHDQGDLVDTSVHEVYPGHHLQLSFARRHPSLLRKVTGPAIFAEGWALYTEELMAELGYYTDEERLMQLAWTLVRAARVVIDVGLHTDGMTFEQAVKILVDEVHLEEPLALSEVKRYTMTPTQPLSYLIGREMIFALRDRYKAREKESFSLKKFHTELLTRGTIAPGLLAREMFPEVAR